MRTFFSSTFIKKEKLKEAGIYHPIKLEYYKIINKEGRLKHREAKFGINIIKKEYRKDGIKVENKKVKYLSNDEKKVERILTTLKENDVTPIAVEDVLSDFSIKMISL